MYYTNTTQRNFSAMRGHMRDGTTVAMDNGDVLTLKMVFPFDWQLYKGDQKVFAAYRDASSIEYLIVNYRGADNS